MYDFNKEGMLTMHANARDFWKTVRSFEGKQTATNIGPIKDSSGVIHADDTSKANTLNSFFVNVGKISESVRLRQPHSSYG